MSRFKDTDQAVDRNAERSGGVPRANALEHLKGILARIDTGQDQVLSEIAGAQSEVLRRYQRVFSDENLPHLSREDFVGFLKYKNNRHWSGIHRHSSKITEDMDALRDALRILLDESLPLRERLDRLYPPTGGKLIQGFGPATFTPVLFVRYPKKYGVYNTPLVTVLKKLGLWKDLLPFATPFSERYIKVNELLLDFAHELDTDLWTLDSLWWRRSGWPTAWPGDPRPPREGLSTQPDPLRPSRHRQDLSRDHLRHGHREGDRGGRSHRGTPRRFPQSAVQSHGRDRADRHGHLPPEFFLRGLRGRHPAPPRRGRRHRLRAPARPFQEDRGRGAGPIPTTPMSSSSTRSTGATSPRSSANSLR